MKLIDTIQLKLVVLVIARPALWRKEKQSAFRALAGQDKVAGSAEQQMRKVPGWAPSFPSTYHQILGNHPNSVSQLNCDVLFIYEHIDRLNRWNLIAISGMMRCVVPGGKSVRIT